ncbi:MAG: N-acetylmuramoyl-L-alanine amidase [Clostridia bacterium]|nr:N-acetylmuramoyl-L-alanine amidase [Clostridia bacterium]
MGRRWGSIAICFLCFFLSGCDLIAPTQSEAREEHLLIDPGHGGADGGTQAQDGTLEKNINLAVATDLRDMMVVCGFAVKMTRESDRSIHDLSDTSIRSKKVSDMRNRLALYQQADAVISLHQNHFSAAKYNGSQVFYSANHEDSVRLARHIQHTIVAQIQPQNTREIKAATDGIYLLYHTTRPAVLVECGFLSNPTERELLNQPAYRQKLAFAITGGYWNYILEE